MELNNIEAFIAVQRTKSFSNAAATLFLSQPAISRRVRLLEQEVGSTLFERMRGGSRGGVQLTAAGQAFLPYAQRVMAAIGDGIEAVQAVKQESRGQLRLALVGTLASTDLTDKLQAFRAVHAQVDLRLSTARSAEVSELVRLGDVQLGLRYFADGSPDLVELPVWEEQQVVVCSGLRGLSAENPLSIDSIKNIPWVTFPARSSGARFAQVMRGLMAEVGLDSAETITVDSLTAQKRIIEADFALGMLPISSIQEELQLGTLRILDVPSLKVAVPVVAIYRRDGFMSHAAQTLLDLLSS